MNPSRLSESTGAAKDVLALFQKANIGDLRYLTFPAAKTQSQAAANSSVIVEETPDSPDGSKRQALDALFEASARLRIGRSKAPFVPGTTGSVAFVSYTGGVGKTTLCATVARTLSSRLASVLVADRCSDGILPYYFNLERQRARGLQTAYPNTRRSGYPIVLVALPLNGELDASTAEWLKRLQDESGMTLLDVPTLERGSQRGEFDSSVQFVIPLVPDVQSIASIARFEELSVTSEQRIRARSLFVLNRFDETRALHREIRAHLEKSLEDRLAPVAVRESEYVCEALSRGMTVIDYVPQAPIVKDFERLASWLEECLVRGPATSAEKTELA